MRDNVSFKATFLKLWCQYPGVTSPQTQLSAFLLKTVVCGYFCFIWSLYIWQLGTIVVLWEDQNVKLHTFQGFLPFSPMRSRHFLTFSGGTKHKKFENCWSKGHYCVLDFKCWQDGTCWWEMCVWFKEKKKSILYKNCSSSSFVEIKVVILNASYVLDECRHIILV